MRDSINNLTVDSKKIEELATNKVKDKILQTDKLRPYINDNDKTPVWDGTVFLYKDSDQLKKKDFTGKVEVQVKGQLNNNLHRATIPFPVDVVDLNIYMDNGGVIFFVVYINKEDNDLRKIYYEDLTPLKIKRYLKGKETQDSLTINLKELPANKKIIESIFINFCSNSKKQHSFKGETISFDDLTKRKDIKNITCEILEYPFDDNSWSQIDVLLKNDNYFYAEIEGNLIPQPIDLSNFKLAIVNENVGSVFVNEKKYDNYVKIIQTKDQITLKFGESTSIMFSNKSDKWKISYVPSKRLSRRIIDLEFLINAFESKEIMLGNNELNIPLSELELNYKIDLDSMRKENELYHRVQQFLDILHIYEDLDLTDVEKNSNWNELMLFVKGVVDKTPISFTTNGEDSFYLNYKKIGNLNILFSMRKVEDSDDLYYIGSYFDEEIMLKIEHNSGEFISSVYSAMIPDNYNELSNINFPNILPSYKPFLKWNVKIFESANFDLLNLLLAYDKVENPKQIILETAKEIAEWILNESGEEVSYNVKLINYLQIIKRERALNIEEQNQLLDIADDTGSDMLSKVAVYLLLDNQLSAERHFNKLEKEWQEAFKSYPIYKFWRESN